ncbi:Pr6Pr family membrane protein [Microbacterium gallinarum]|nr:Pr6Pr family membrane protein [Microbacterium gallinarum]
MRSKAWAQTWSVMRLAMAALIIAAVLAQLAKSLSTAAELGRDVGTTLANFFSFFTILSNTLAAVVLVWAALWFFTRGRHANAEPPALALALACVTTYMIITGVVYNLLLRQIVLDQGSAPIPWSNEVLHLIGPLFLLADLFVGPLRRALPWRAVWAIIAFPILWVLYTMLRGPLVTNPVTGDPYWYPYPFLNPNGTGGWPTVVFWIVVISIAFLVFASLIVWWGRRVGAERELDHLTGDHVEEEWSEARQAEVEGH